MADVRREEEDKVCVAGGEVWSLGRGESGIEFKSGAIVLQYSFEGESS